MGGIAGFLRKSYGLGGLFILLIMQAAAWLGISPLNIWVTPIGWYGYILFVDGCLEARSGRSLLIHRTGEFLAMFPVSVGLWCVFELHNLRFKNWEYIGLPESDSVTAFAMIISFATILPAIMVTAEFLEGLGVGKRKPAARTYPERRLIAGIAAGMVLIAIPTIAPSIYTGPLIWGGYFLVFVSLNRLLGIPNGRDGERRMGMTNLLLAGYICGIVWETLNYWAATKWIYHVPYLADVKLFEMPVPGFLGFGPFAVAIAEMYWFLMRFPGMLIGLLPRTGFFKRIHGDF
ncbi:MAG TPA: hypothetical protein PKL97_01785 [Candidatus Omnitrophota bacterium]|nr:hypothetical protein [Candidatus Omnitrophota bacterium]